MRKRRCSGQSGHGRLPERGMSAARRARERAERTAQRLAELQAGAGSSTETVKRAAAAARVAVDVAEDDEQRVTLGHEPAAQGLEQSVGRARAARPAGIEPATIGSKGCPTRPTHLAACGSGAAQLAGRRCNWLRGRQFASQPVSRRRARRGREGSESRVAALDSFRLRGAMSTVPHLLLVARRSSEGVSQQALLRELLTGLSSGTSAPAPETGAGAAGTQWWRDAVGRWGAGTSSGTRHTTRAPSSRARACSGPS
jgi:hypothetical protein